MIRIAENKIIGTATLVNYGSGGVTETTQDDDAGDRLTEYWRVRRKLEKICNNTMILINTKAKKKDNSQITDEFKK